MKKSRIDIISSNGNDGSHYAEKPSYYANNDPYQFAMDNNLNALEFNIVKYVTRRKGEQRMRDLECARNTLERLIEMEKERIDG